MGLKDKLRSTVYRMDLLSSPPILRSRGEDNHESICGGIFSIIVMVAFGAIFYKSFLSVINRLDITYSSNLSDDTSSTSSITNVQFAIGIDGVDFSVTPWKFKISLNQKDIQVGSGGATNMTTSSIALKPCVLS